MVAGSGGRRHWGWVLPSTALLLAAASACGPAEESLDPQASLEQAHKLETTNGLSLNGLSLNGLSLNGLSLNGLSLEGLSTPEFESWFRTNPELNDMVMKYVVLCAVPAGVRRTYTAPHTGDTYVWTGRLGLAPDWSNGSPATVTEQRIVSACLAAHANKYGINISISVQGLSATGVPIPVSTAELVLFSEKEACFFGNLFTQESIYVGNDGRPLNDRESTARACALSTRSNLVSQECPPMVRVEQDCARYCTLDASRRFYVSCTYDGITWPSITTRMLRKDIYTCGDGVCQRTESCGTGETYDNCGRDCGPCP
ncbi:hypothetical protein JRI60_29860 [Archangium violaceum]|nr:hypothetical protein JRI60_29860 [Archangium violaceum]